RNMRDTRPILADNLPMPAVIDLPLDRIRAYCRAQPIRKLSLFGSVLRDDFGPDSDVDMLVEFKSGARISLLDMAHIERELGNLIGRTVDFRTAEDLHRRFRQQVVDEAELIYEG